MKKLGSWIKYIGYFFTYNTVRAQTQGSLMPKTVFYCIFCPYSSQNPWLGLPSLNYNNLLTSKPQSEEQEEKVLFDLW